jgi:hypothetical protein
MDSYAYNRLCPNGAEVRCFRMFSLCLKVHCLPVGHARKTTGAWSGVYL